MAFDLFQHASPTDATIVAPRSHGAAHSDVECDSDAPCAKVALVEGSGPHLSGETTSLLRYRLRIVAWILGVASAAFLLRNYFLFDFSSGSTRFIFAFHTLVTVALLANAVWLSSKRPTGLKWLRVAELVIFGAPVLLFLIIDYLKLSAVRPTISSTEATWLLFLFTYGMFIPNGWRRAAVVIGGMAAVPVVLQLVMWFAYPGMRDRVELLDLTGTALTMLTAAIIGVAGVHIIGTLRRQAFEARQLGQYRLRRLLGAGGMGEVYLADHQMMKRPVAIKLIRPGQAKDPTMLARFEREVRATAKLSHWNTIEIYDFGSTACGSFYYVMEFLPGLSLADLVKQHGPLPPERAIHLLRQACDGLQEAHAIGLIHRDIKPANIFAAQRGGIYDVTKVLDFGLAKPMAESDPDAVQLTMAGSITGSPLYMSPEQASGDSEPDAHSDVYSLGAVAYFLLTGRPPFQGDNPVKILLAHARDEVVPPSQLRSEVSSDLEQVVLRALAKKPEDRYQDVNAFAAALAECEAADHWSRDDAFRWWQTNGQPTDAASESENAALVA